MKPLVLCILDGVGIRKDAHGNAVKMAKMPVFSELLNKYPHSLLEASEENVGLPKGQMGNSEVGHTNIGAGRVVYQPLEIINRSIKDKSFFSNKKIIDFMSSQKKLHLLGLLSDGGIHSNINHLFALIDMAKDQGIEELYIHIFTDGRDTLPDCALNFIKRLEEKLKNVGLGEIASISGRYYAMDRDNNFDRIKLEYDVLTQDTEEVKDYKENIKTSYENNIYDEFIKPIKVTNKGTIKDGDNLIVFNFRPDRLRELFSSLTNPAFDKFETNIKTNLLTMFSVSDEVIFDNVFKPLNLDNCFGPYIDSLGLKQLRIAETEKYAHVTYFFDGGKELNLKNSTRTLIPSPKVKTYDLKPEMSAIEITDKLLTELDKDIYDVVILNYANGDMVGHTGDMDATIKALEILDSCLGRLFNKIKEKKGLLVVTADHGNSDYMLDAEDNKITSHSMSKVPFIVTNKKYKLKNGKLADIAPTLLYLLGLKKPKEMTGNNLVVKKSIFKNLFMIISLLVFFISLFVYSFRLVHFYKIEHPKLEEQDNTLATKIISDNEIQDGTGFNMNDSDYIFNGNVTNNYVYYSNQLWRIIKIDKDKKISLITDDNVSSLVYSYDTNNYQDSYAYSWLNDKYYNSLNNPDKYLEENKWCVSPGKTKEENCKKKTTSKVGLLAYYQYKIAGANKGFLNINKYYWTLTPSEENKTWYVFAEGGVNDNSYEDDNYHSYGVRPVITIKNSVNYVSGTGTKEDPYRFEEPEQLGVGSYIKYSNYNFRIINKDETKLTLALSDTLKNQEHIFSNKTSSYKANDYNSLYSYLNNTFYYKLDKKLLVDGTWYIGSYNVDTKYDYNKLYDQTVISKVGLLNVSDLFTTDTNSYFTSTNYSDQMVFTTSEDGSLQISDISEKQKIRPVINITNQIKVVSGDGTKENPYIVEGV